MDDCFYSDNHIQIFNKDCRSMDELADESVQCVVTSPPYWGLRKYAGLPDLVWGEKECEHNFTLEDKQAGQKHWNQGGQVIPNDERTIHNGGVIQQGFCSLCGAWKGAYGLEPDPSMYVQHTIEILREIRRVLRKDGVVFWNIGDSYYGSGGDHKEGGKNDAGFQGDLRRGVQPKQQRHSLLKPKDLCLIPFRVAIAAQEDGWWVRSVIIWSKPNPMPESVTDRPTESHEYILMLTKSARYYWDADAVREPYTEPMNRWGGQELKANGESKWDKGTGQETYRDRDMRPNPTGRNLRSVWEFPTQPYPEAHFAVFPEKLPEICIKAATPEVGCCSKCGAPWERIIEKTSYGKEGWAPSKKDATKDLQGSQSFNRMEGLGACGMVDVQTLGWRPTCKCKTIKPPVPSLVLDPFAGAGTTLWVAKKLNRTAGGYELSQEYCELAVERTRQQALDL